MDRPRRIQLPSQPTPDEKAATAAERAKIAEYAFAMQALKGSAHWDIYKEILEDVEKQMIQGLITCPPDQHDFTRGYILGMRNAYNMPTFIIDKQKNLD
jgi:hypothetical protein